MTGGRRTLLVAGLVVVMATPGIGDAQRPVRRGPPDAVVVIDASESVYGPISGDRAGDDRGYDDGGERPRPGLHKQRDRGARARAAAPGRGRRTGGITTVTSGGGYDGGSAADASFVTITAGGAARDDAPDRSCAAGSVGRAAKPDGSTRPC